MLILALMAGCAPKEDAAAPTPPPPEVKVSEVVSREVTDYEEFTGRTDSKETVEVRARVSGYLTEVLFEDGEDVEPGDPLYQIDPRPFQATLDYAEGQKAQWEATLARTESDVKRYEELVPSGAATPQDLDKAIAERGEATAAIQSAEATIDQAKLDLEFSRITAPIGGLVSRALITKGNLVRANVDLLTLIVSIDPVYVYFNVDERTFLRFRERARKNLPTGAVQPDQRSLKIPVYLGLASEDGFPHEGVIDFADNRVDPGTGTIRVRGTFDNANQFFKPGLFARVRVPVSDPYQALLVTDRAIGIDQGMKYLLVMDDQNVVTRTFIEPGPIEDDGLRIINTGLEPGAVVVVNGLQRVVPGKPVTPERVDMPRRTGEVAVTPTIAPPTVAPPSASKEPTATPSGK